MAGHVMIGHQITVLGDDGTAADGLHFDLAPFAKFSRDHANAHQSAAQLIIGLIDLGAKGGRRTVLILGAATDRDGHDQNEARHNRRAEASRNETRNHVDVI